jgi:2-haloacid dehalogenase
MSAPALYAFDAYGTLFDVHAPVTALADAIGPDAARLSDIWRTKQLQYTWTLSLAGRYRPFWSLTEEALDFAIASVGGIAGGLRAKLLDAYWALEAYPEAGSVLRELKARGARLAILSNGDAKMLKAAVSGGGLDGIFDALVSVEGLSIYKPDPKVYRLLTDRFECAPEDVSFQSSNRWDIAGAKAFGFRTVWINRFGQPEEYPDLPADRTATSLGVLLD